MIFLFLKAIKTIKMEAITIHPQNNEQLEAIKSVLKALKIPFDKKESAYNPEFVKKIKEAEVKQEGAVFLNKVEDIDNYFNNLAPNVQD
jgi:transcriptional/translational regulatory protein YebC/TACO1